MEAYDIRTIDIINSVIIILYIFFIFGQYYFFFILFTPVYSSVYEQGEIPTNLVNLHDSL